MNGRTGMKRGLGVALVAALVLAACGSDDDGSSDSSTGSVAGAESSDASTSSADGTFPVTIEHKYGETTVEERPQRIAVVGLTEQDALLALGIAPIATTEWFGGYDGSIWPWAQDELEALGGNPPVSLGDSTAYNFEELAAQRPDLILGVYSGMTEEDYETFSAIAPTIAQPGEYIDYGVPWDEELLIVGEAVGQLEAAEAAVAEVEALFEEARTEHAEFAGAEAVMATPYEGIFVYGPEDPRGRFLTSLGFALPDGLDELSGDEFGGQLSTERVDVLDLDAVVWLDLPEDADDPALSVYRALPVHTEGRDVFLSSDGDPLGGATSFVTVLSLPFLIEGLVPRLAAAVDGDPETSTDG